MYIRGITTIQPVCPSQCPHMFHETNPYKPNIVSFHVVFKIWALLCMNRSIYLRGSFFCVFIFTGFLDLSDAAAACFNKVILFSSACNDSLTSVSARCTSLAKTSTVSPLGRFS